MTLSSQTSRPNAGRKYMVSRKRKARRWPWLVVVLLAVGLLFVFRPWSSGEAGRADAEPDSAASAESVGGGADPSDPAATRGSDEASPSVPSMTVSRSGVREETPERAEDAASGATRSASSGEDEQPGSRDVRGGGETESGAEAASRFADQPERVSAAFRRGRELITEGKFVGGRRVLSSLLFDPGVRLRDADAQTIRDMLTSVNEQLVFGPEVHPGDPVAEYYLVQRGDLLAKIGPQYKVPYQFLERINNVDARRLQAGKPIKAVNGPFHARVIKRDYRMDLFLRGPDGQPVYVKSYPVGLGQEDSTPAGLWRIEAGKKVKNPDWRNPRTGEYFARNDPENPIGEYWLALEGIDDDTRGVPGYGIHGTVDPDSIGDQASMGCIRLRSDDIEEVFGMFVGGESTVRIIP